VVWCGVWWVLWGGGGGLGVLGWWGCVGVLWFVGWGGVVFVVCGVVGVGVGVLGGCACACQGD